jgi:hypothetical protein
MDIILTPVPVAPVTKRMKLESNICNPRLK